MCHTVEANRSIEKGSIVTLDFVGFDGGWRKKTGNISLTRDRRMIKHGVINGDPHRMGIE